MTGPAQPPPSPPLHSFASPPLLFLGATSCVLGSAVRATLNCVFVRAGGVPQHGKVLEHRKHVVSGGWGNGSSGMLFSAAASDFEIRESLGRAEGASAARLERRRRARRPGRRALWNSRPDVAASRYHHPTPAKRQCRFLQGHIPPDSGRHRKCLHHALSIHQQTREAAYSASMVVNIREVIADHGSAAPQPAARPSAKTWVSPIFSVSCCNIRSRSRRHKATTRNGMPAFQI